MESGYNFFGSANQEPQKMQNFPGLPGFLVIPTFKDSQGIPSSHPDKVYFQNKQINIVEEINNTITKLKEVETPEYRCKKDNATISEERKKYTLELKSLLKLKEEHI